jgi:hypothetical protein
MNVAFGVRKEMAGHDPTHHIDITYSLGELVTPIKQICQTDWKLELLCTLAAAL